MIELLSTHRESGLRLHPLPRCSTLPHSLAVSGLFANNLPTFTSRVGTKLGIRIDRHGMAHSL